MGTSVFNGSNGTIGTTSTDDRFSFTGTITDSTPTTEIGIPSAGQIMSIRYYNASTVAGATDFGAISDPSGGEAWLWESPASVPPTGMTFAFGDTGVVYEGAGGVVNGSDTVPETNISLVPEPATLSAMAGAVAVGAMVLRRRKNRSL
jgi:hypothetical protein